MKLKNKKALVTGGAGFIGSHLVDRLIKEGYRAIVVDDLSAGKKENLNKKAEFYKVDIVNPKVAGIFRKEKPDFVFHFAAHIEVRESVKDPISDAEINILGSLNILENCKKFKVKKVIFASSGGAIYGEAEVIPTPEDYFANPLSPYGVAKLTIERYLNYYYKVFNLPFVSLRLANVYGPRQNSKGEAGVIAIFCEKMLNEEQAVINGGGSQTRDFIFVDDVIRTNILAVEKNKTGVFNIGTAKETDINTIFRELRKMTKSEYKEKHGAKKIGEQKRSCLDYSKAKKEFNWQPKVSLRQGLKITADWFKSRK